MLLLLITGHILGCHGIRPLRFLWAEAMMLTYLVVQRNDITARTITSQDIESTKKDDSTFVLPTPRMVANQCRRLLALALDLQNGQI
ncbi:hypothetical protein AKJ16_DCAP24937 [Drosera capensis]